MRWQQEELGVENKAACYWYYCISWRYRCYNNKEGARQENAEERLVLKWLREIFEIKGHDDIPSVKNIDLKKTKRKVELLYSVIANAIAN